MMKHGTFSGKQNILNKKLRANPGCRTELPRGSCPWWEFCGCNCAVTIVRVQLTQVEIVQKLISLVEISQMVVARQLIVQRTIVLDVNCPEGICPGRLIIWGEIVRGGQLSCHPFYVILTFSFVVRIEAGDCILLLNNFLFKLLKTSYIKDSEAVARSCSVRKSVPKNFAKKRFWYRCFPVNFAKFLRTPFLAEHLRWLLLMIQ